MSLARFYEIPAAHVPEGTRRQAARWTAQAAGELGLPAVSIRWFARADRIRVVPWGPGLDVFEAPPTTAGMVHAQDGPTTIRLRSDLAPTLDFQELGHYVAHECRHLSGHAAGKAWGDPAEEAACELFAARFCARQQRALRYGKETTMTKYSIVNGRVWWPGKEEQEVAAERLRLKRWLGDQVEPTVGPGPGPATVRARSVTDFTQAAAGATRLSDLERLVGNWWAAYDGGDLSDAAAGVCLAEIEGALARIEGPVSRAPGPAPRAAPPAQKTGAREAAPTGVRRMEYKAAPEYHGPPPPRHWVDGAGVHHWTISDAPGAPALPLT